MNLLNLIRERSDEEGDCLIWRGWANGDGYAAMKLCGCSSRVLRFLALEAGPIKKGMQASNTCGNRLCVNPEHLVMRTRKQAGRVAGKRGALSTMARGAAISRGMRKKSRLTVEDVSAIRASGESLRQIATKYGIAPSTAGAIRRGERWRPLGGLWI